MRYVFSGSEGDVPGRSYNPQESAGWWRLHAWPWKVMGTTSDSP